LLRDASLANYQAGQSVLHFDQSGVSLTSEATLTLSAPAASQQLPSQVPGYEILEVLGKGGMGTVYKARDVRLDRTVALKVLPARAEAASESLVRFQREAIAVAKLGHPNIVQVYGLFEHEGFQCLALEYVGGGDLARKMRTEKEQAERLPISKAAEMMLTLARAVHYAHQKGILHRDLKPSNILLTSEGEPEIADFGLSKILDERSARPSDTLVCTIMGTPGYMAPEQWRGTVASSASDIYALGMILYEMLAGRRPFENQSHHELMYHTLTEPPPSLTQLR